MPLDAAAVGREPVVLLSRERHARIERHEVFVQLGTVVRRWEKSLAKGE